MIASCGGAEAMCDLIRRLEGAKEGSDSLSRAVGAAVMIPTRTVGLHGDRVGAPHIQLFRYPDGSEGTPLDFTRSVDAALSLIPEGHSLGGLWEAVKAEDRPWWGCDIRQDEPQYAIFKALGAKSKSLALCIACLKAISKVHQ